MTMITRWDPFRELTSLQREMNRLFQDVNAQGRSESDLTTSGAWAPPVDVWEDENNLVLKVEVPGVKEEDIDIRVENNTLTIRGERKFEQEVKKENFHRVERSYGSFARSFTLPATFDTENVNAEYDNGVLTLSLPKRAEAKPRQIKIGTGGSKKTLEGKTKAA